MEEKNLKQILQKLKPMLGKKADLIWRRYQFADRIERTDWAQKIRWLAQKHGIDEVDDAIVMPPPKPEECIGDLPLGSIRYIDQKQSIALRLAELTRHCGVFGSTGTGKTTFAKHLLRQLLAKNIPFIIFDWETNYRDLAAEDERIKIFTVGSEVSPFRFNFFRLPPGMETFADYVKAVIDVFSRAYVGGVGADSILLKTFDEAYRQHEVPTTADAMHLLAADMTGSNMKGREMLWRQSSLRMLQFLSYGGTGEIYNTAKSVPMERLVEDYVVFELGGLHSPQDKRFFVEAFILWYWMYLQHQGIEHETLKHVLLLEEFHNILATADQKNDFILKLFRQIRKYGTGLVLLDQTPSLIPNPVFENLNTLLSFSLIHARNISAMAQAMYLDKEERDSIGLLKTGQAVCRIAGRTPRPFLLEVPFTKSRPDLTDKELRKRMRLYYDFSSPNQASFHEMESLQTPTPMATPSPLERIFLEDVLINPFDGVDKRGKRLGLSPREVTEIQRSLLTNGFLVGLTIDRKRLFELSASAEDFLCSQGHEIDHSHKSQGLEHRYFVDQVSRVLRKQGWQVELEKNDIDLTALRNDQILAIEIETGSNNPGQYEKNLAKLLNADVSHRLILASNQTALNKALAAIEQFDPDQKDSIKILPVKAFLKHPSL